MERADPLHFCFYIEVLMFFKKNPEKNPVLTFYPMFSDVEIPEYHTEDSACFDLKTYLKNSENLGDSIGFVLDAYNKHNFKFEKVVYPYRGKFDINAGERVLIPTGLRMDIPKGYSLRLHIRSSVAFKQGLVLVNGEGIIDSDYIDPIMMLIQNTTDVSVPIHHGDRLCQAEIVKVEKNSINFKTRWDNSLTQKTDRTGGFGSTGK